jgi:murein DD-endopeptidase MepM/ murein hydrolase activator NlpD
MHEASERKPPRHYAPALRRVLKTIVVLALLAAAAHWSWRQPFMAKPRTLWELSRMPPPSALAMPVEGLPASRVADTFGAPRGRDRSHAGVDIFAARGTPVRSTTRGVVAAVREGGLGGRQVWVLGPARQRHYYAHLDDWAPGLAVGDIVLPGDALGAVGNTGNARGTPPHLHYGVYGEDGAIDPLPLLRAGARGSPATR